MKHSYFKETFKDSLLENNQIEAFELYKNIEKKHTDIDFIEDIMLPVLAEIGDDWNKGEAALSQVYVSGRICEDVVNLIFADPHPEYDSADKVAIVNFKDQHPLGKKIVSSVLKLNGIPLLDYGFGVEQEELIRKLKKDNPKILIISVLMLPSALKIKNLRMQLLEEGIDIKILVGGAPFRFDKSLWKKVCADAFGDTPIDTLNIIKEWRKEL